ncbi:MAG: hypothetical protein NTZ17_00480 [Phycisphaerae bacterium]|nr:hypothetical protein [Phycisphaerae bacterium]
MKSNSYSKVTARGPQTRRVALGTRITLVAAAVALVIVSWPATGRGQSQSRRDRSRRDVQTGPSSGRPGSSRPDSSKSPTASAATASPTGRITGSVEPNAAAKSAERPPSQPVERPRPRRPVQDEQWAKYDIILTRNMFSRQRIPPPSGEPIVEPPKPMPNPESYLLLKGVAQENNQFIAFVEDKQSGSVLRLRQGDHVARGTIKSVNLDGLEYQLGDQTTSVSMGFDLEGRHGAVTAGDLASYSPTAAAAVQGASTGQPAAPPADEAEILKRLMEQRKQQLGQ